METLKGTMIQNLYVPQNNKIKNYNERKTTSLFRNNSVSFYNDVNTEAICLLVGKKTIKNRPCVYTYFYVCPPTIFYFLIYTNAKLVPVLFTYNQDRATQPINYKM